MKGVDWAGCKIDVVITWKLIEDFEDTKEESCLIDGRIR